MGNREAAGVTMVINDFSILVVYLQTK